MKDFKMCVALMLAFNPQIASISVTYNEGKTFQKYFVESREK